MTQSAARYIVSPYRTSLSHTEFPMIITRDAFQTIGDATLALDGYCDLWWNEAATFAGWCDYAYRNAVATWNEADFSWEWDRDAVFATYLRSVGENPSDMFWQEALA